MAERAHEDGREQRGREARREGEIERRREGDRDAASAPAGTPAAGLVPERGSVLAAGAASGPATGSASEHDTLAAAGPASEPRGPLAEHEHEHEHEHAPDDALDDAPDPALEALLDRGLRVDRAPRGFTAAVMARVAAARAASATEVQSAGAPSLEGVLASGARPRRPDLRRPDPPPDAGRTRPRPSRARLFFYATAASWLLNIGLHVALFGPPQAPGALGSPGIARAERVVAPPHWVRMGTGADDGDDLAFARALVDDHLGEQRPRGYELSAWHDSEDPRAWWVILAPRWSSGSGLYYRIDTDGVVRLAQGTLPTPDSPVLDAGRRRP